MRICVAASLSEQLGPTVSWLGFTPGFRLPSRSTWLSRPQTNCLVVSERTAVTYGVTGLLVLASRRTDPGGSWLPEQNMAERQSAVQLSGTYLYMDKYAINSQGRLKRRIYVHVRAAA